eukprot:713742-Amphidinium_carterae.1
MGASPGGKSVGKGLHKSQTNSPVLRRVRIPDTRAPSQRLVSPRPPGDAEDSAKRAARLVVGKYASPLAKSEAFEMLDK